MKTIEEIRKENLENLIKTEGSVIGLSKRIGKSESQISQWRNNSTNSGTGKGRNIGPGSCRQIEKELGLPKAWMDTDHNKTHEQQAVSRQTRFIDIPFLAIDGTETPEAFPLPQQILDSLDLKPNAARIIQAYSGSMHPTIKNGSRVIIDTTDKTPQDGKIYLIKDGERGEKLLLKRLIFEYNYLLEKSIWVMKSDNQDKKTFPDKFLPPVGTADIIGRAVWHDNRL